MVISRFLRIFREEPGAAEVARKLTAKTDALLEKFHSDVMERMGLCALTKIQSSGKGQIADASMTEGTALLSSRSYTD